jgi:tetratricopeptide (TPR) repeat protein
MKRPFVVLILVVSILFCSFSYGKAEKIYRKDGNVIDGTIIYRTKNSIWLRHPSGAVGVNLEDIDRIEDEDGSISRYGYKSIYDIIQNSLGDKEYDRAVGACDLLLRSFPENSQLHYLRAILNQKMGNLKNAVEDYDFLIQEESANAEIFNNLGVIYAGNKEYNTAKELFLKAIGIDAVMSEAHNNLAETLMQLKDYDDAIEEYKKVLELESDNPKVLYNFGIAYMKKGDYRKAKEQWEKLIAIRPDDIDAKKALEYLNEKIN